MWKTLYCLKLTAQSCAGDCWFSPLSRQQTQKPFTSHLTNSHSRVSGISRFACYVEKCFTHIYRALYRVWKGILGIRDLPKIRCVNRENDKYLDGTQDLAASPGAGLAKIWAWDAGFFACLLGIREIVTTHMNLLAAKAACVLPLLINKD